jgi:hypothetical protein
MINEKYKLIENVNPYTPYTPVIKHGWKIQHGELPLKAPIQGFQSHRCAHQSTSPIFMAV